MAHCADQGVRTGNVSGSCASRRMGWRDAPFQNSKLNWLQRIPARRAEQLARRTSTGNCADSAFN
ncbi:hypothetical protein A2U01_0087850 [Trifolium medium]|uniref:Uncharacterized protein n=1 Tax=Trifolium medium TaxID=97028 RepID=A0A392TZJ1_9FABA|nr:hypothetical protein [Trifolium medium]